VDVTTTAANSEQTQQSADELVSDLARYGREFVVADPPAGVPVSRDAALQAAIEFNGSGDPDTAAVFYGTYSRAEMARNLPEEVAEVNAKLLEAQAVYVVNLVGVLTYPVGPGGAEGAEPNTERNVVVDANTGEIVESISFK
jgi:hypothetical protein